MTIKHLGTHFCSGQTSAVTHYKVRVSFFSWVQKDVRMEHDCFFQGPWRVCKWSETRRVASQMSLGLDQDFASGAHVRLTGTKRQGREAKMSFSSFFLTCLNSEKKSNDFLFHCTLWIHALPIILIYFIMQILNSNHDKQCTQQDYLQLNMFRKPHYMLNWKK